MESFHFCKSSSPPHITLQLVMSHRVQVWLARGAQWVMLCVSWQLARCSSIDLSVKWRSCCEVSGSSLDPTTQSRNNGLACGSHPFDGLLALGLPYSAWREVHKMQVLFRIHCLWFHRNDQLLGVNMIQFFLFFKLIPKREGKLNTMFHIVCVPCKTKYIMTLTFFYSFQFWSSWRMNSIF